MSSFPKFLQGLVEGRFRTWESGLRRSDNLERLWFWVSILSHPFPSSTKIYLLVSGSRSGGRFTVGENQSSVDQIYFGRVRCDPGCDRPVRIQYWYETLGSETSGTCNPTPPVLWYLRFLTFRNDYFVLISDYKWLMNDTQVVSSEHVESSDHCPWL